MAPLVALSLCTAGLSLRSPAMNGVIDKQRRHPCLMCLRVFRGRSFLELSFLSKFSGYGCSSLVHAWAHARFLMSANPQQLLKGAALHLVDEYIGIVSIWLTF